ncbi:MAG: hypothetical protein M3332_17470 [Actinomycetota bacterium]|nr:hypothetical protein [Actinomycetota bacterium]
MAEMTHVTIRIAKVHCRGTEDVTGADELYTVSTLATGNPSQTQAAVMPKFNINDNETKYPNYVIYDSWIDEGSSVRGGLVVYDEDFAKDWAKRPQWVDKLTNAVAQWLQNSGDPKKVTAGKILQYGYKAFDLIASADKDDKLASIELDISEGGPQKETQTWNFRREDPTGFSDWNYSVDLEILRSRVPKLTAVWRHPGDISDEVQAYAWPLDDVRAKYDELWGQGFRLHILHAAPHPDGIRYDAVWRGPGDFSDEVQAYAWPLDDVRAKYDELWGQGFRLHILERSQI